MNCGFIIKLSGNKISFLYNKTDKNGLFPFDGNRPVLPLAILRKEEELVIGEAALKAHQTGSADAFVDVLKDAKRPGTFKLLGKDHAYGELLLLAVEKHISEFMQQAYLLQGKTYDDLKPELPIGFLFNDCVTEADQEYVLQSFESHGYGNVSKIDFNTYLFNNFRTPNVLVVSGDGRDLALRLYDREGAKLQQQRLLPGAGTDPRVKAVAELFFNNLTPAGVAKEKAMPKLEIEAMEVLERNPAEHESAITVDGMPFEFFVTRREIETASANIAGQSQNLGIVEFLHEAGTDISDCSMIVSPTLAANSYFRNELKNAFPEIKLVDEAIEQDVLKAIDGGMREGGFDMHKFGDADSGIIAEGPVVKNQTEDGITILGNKMAKKDIKGEPHATYIIFNITVPKGAAFVEIRRRDHKAPKEEEKVIKCLAPTFDDAEGGEENRTLVPTEYTDQGLKELTPYRYNFVAVYFDEYGQRSHTADLELDYRTVPDVVTNEKPITVLVANDTETKAFLKWSVPKRAKLKMFYSDSPFTQKANDVILDEAEIAGIDLHIDDADQQYIVKKDFHGEHFFLPVTVRSGRMVAGDPVCVQSKPQPHDVKATYVKDEDVVRVEWEWGDLRNVQVVWQYPGDNRNPIDVIAGSESRVDVVKAPTQSQVLVEVRSVFTSKVDGSQVVGVPVKRTVTIPPKPAPPKPAPKAEPVETVSVRPSDDDVPTFTEPKPRPKPQPQAQPASEPTFTSGSTGTSTGNGGGSHTLRNVIVVLLLCVGAYFVYNNFIAGKNDKPEEPALIDYTSVAISPTDATLTVGDTLTITLTGEPQGANESVTWESKNATVASVDAQGVVTAHKAGNVDIVGTTDRTKQIVKMTIRVKAQKGKRDPKPESGTSSVSTPVDKSKDGSVKIGEGVSIELPAKKSNGQTSSQPENTTGNSGGIGFKLEKIKNN